MLHHTPDAVKVSIAVILAARKERDSHTPYPLLAFANGQCLLDRTLALLRDIGITQIVIVVGYQAHMFEPYRSDDVRIVYSEDYLFSSSMASLAKAKDYINSSFLLIEGDTFFERAVIEQLYSSTSANCLAISDESGSGDEAFVEIEQGYLKKVSKDRHQICQISGELLGIAKISLPTYERMLEAWQVSNNPYLNYEYLLVDVTNILQRPCLHFKELIWGDVDCHDDFVQLQNYIYPKLRRKEDPFDYDNILMHLESIFSDRPIQDDLTIKQIGGMSNRNYHVSLLGQEYILRIPGLGSEGMVVRRYECQNDQHAARLGINPSVRFFSEESGVKLADYIDQAETLNQATIQRHDNMRQIARILRTLHNSEVRFNNDFNVLREIQHYEDLIEAHVASCSGTLSDNNGGGGYYADYKRIKSIVSVFEAELNTIGVSLAPCHNDLVAENFIKSKDKIYLIDWEYSGMNDPMWDIAALFLESRFSQENQDYFLRQYFATGEVSESCHRKIKIYQILMDLLWSLWTIIKENKGEDFGSYGLDRYQRAVQGLIEMGLYGKS